MQIRVHYLGQISAVVKKREENVEAASRTTVYTLLKHLADRYGDAFEGEVFEEGEKEVREGVIVTVNGRAIGQLQGTDTRLKGGDVITLLPLFAGGG
jgi:MoaD family protein